MGKLIYSAIASLDGYVEDADGRFDWRQPDEELFRFLNELERPIGTHLYGRRMYETLLSWETVPLDGQPAHIRDWTLIWRGADKIVYSRTLTSPSSARTRIEPSFDPEAVRRLRSASPHNLAIGGAELAGAAIRTGLVDELQLFALPVSVGGGKPWLPRDVHLEIELVDTHRFTSGALWSTYRNLRVVPKAVQ